MLTQDGTPVELQRNFAVWQWPVPSYLLSKVFQVAEYLLYHSFELMISYNFLKKLSHETVSKALLASRYMTSAHKDPYPAREENWVRLKRASVCLTKPYSCVAIISQVVWLSSDLLAAYMAILYHTCKALCSIIFLEIKIKKTGHGLWTSPYLTTTTKNCYICSFLVLYNFFPLSGVFGSLILSPNLL